MKSLIKPGLILCSALLTGMPLFSQVKTDQSLTNSQNEAKMYNQDKNKAAVRKLYEEILNTGKLELLNQVVSEEFIGVREAKGPAGFAATISPVRAAFPDIKWTIEDLIAEGDKVVVRWTWKGTNTGSFAGFPPCNKQVTHSAISIFQFSDDKIIKAWMAADRLDFFQQIGVISADITTPPAKK